jgi:hypothetical protein
MFPKAGTSCAAAMPRPVLVEDPLQIGPEWFNEVFAHTGVAATVRSVTATRIGTGQVGANIRFSLTYDAAPPEAPATLIGKFPSPDAQTRETARALGIYRREYHVYTVLERATAKLSPRLHYADYDEASDRFVLLMEDQAPAIQGDQLAGCDLSVARQAMSAAATLHAAYWNDPVLDTYPWLDSSAAAPPSVVTPELMAGLWNGFKTRYTGRLSAEAIAVGDRVATRLHDWASGYQGPKCLSHADFRLDNFLLGGPRQALVVVDWQTAAFRAPALDVAYFLGAGLIEERRRTHEAELVALYHRHLVEAGVTGYSLDALWRDYRWFAFYGVQMAFGAAMLVGQTERGDAMFLTMLHRHVDQILAIDALSLLPA